MVLIITGNTIIANVKEPDTIENCNLRVDTKNTVPNSPYIIDGIPARLSVANLINLTPLPCFAYSCKYIAPQIPIGIDINKDNITVNNVVTIIGNIPPPFVGE